MKLLTINRQTDSSGSRKKGYRIITWNHAGILAFVTFLLLNFSQCSPIEIPTDDIGDPVFTLSMTTDGGEILTFGGGIDGYRMFTSYEQGIDGVYTFIGEFKKEDASQDTFPSVRFEIRDFQVNPLSVDVEQALSLANSFFNQTLTGATDTIYQATFTAATGQSCPGLSSGIFSWNFDDGTYGEGYSVTHEYANSQERMVELEINGSSGEFVQVSRNLSFTSNAFPCGVQVNAFQNNTLNITASPVGGVQPYAYSWSNGAATQTISLPMDSTVLDQSYCVTLTDSFGCSSSWCGNILPDFQICNAQFSYAVSMDIDSTEAPVQLSAITIIYNNGHGGVYRTDRQEQGLSSFFDVLMVEDFQENEFGEPTKKVNLNFGCELFSVDGEVIKFESGEGTIGVASPE